MVGYRSSERSSCRDLHKCGKLSCACGTPVLTMLRQCESLCSLEKCKICGAEVVVPNGEDANKHMSEHIESTGCWQYEWLQCPICESPLICKQHDGDSVDSVVHRHLESGECPGPPPDMGESHSSSAPQKVESSTSDASASREKPAPQGQQWAHASAMKPHDWGQPSLVPGWLCEDLSPIQTQHHLAQGQKREQLAV